MGLHRLKDLARPEHIFGLVHPDLRRDFPPLRSLDTYRHNLPEQRTPLFGRTAEAEEVEQLISADRLVTLTGSGGCGKTRLALHVASRLLDAYPDGVHFVDLSSIRDASAVPTAINEVLGLAQEPDTVLVPYLRDKAALIILDNCEHLITACAETGDQLLAGTSAVRLLATSREPLGIAGEVTYRVPSLAAPPDGEPGGIEGLSAFAAAELFVDRARRTRADFHPTDDDATAISEICRRLDGIPLAIELAAARVRAFTPREIADAIGERFRLLTGKSRTALPRQQTLQASMDWSYDLLTQPERSVFERLAVFAGGFTLAAARRVCAAGDIDSHQVVDLVSLLVDKSLVVVDSDGASSRYRLLETIREYAATRLAERGEHEATATRHRDYFLGLCERLAPPSDDWVSRWSQIDPEIDNVRDAFEFSRMRKDVEHMARFAILMPYLRHRGARVDSRRWFGELFDQLDLISRDVRTDLAFLWTTDGDSEPLFLPYVEEAVEYYHQQGDVRRAARAAVAKVIAGWAVHVAKGEAEAIARGRETLEEALRASREAGDIEAEYAILQTHVGPMSWVIEGIDPDRARDELLGFGRRHPTVMPVALGGCAAGLRSKGDCRAALTLLREMESLTGDTTTGYPFGGGRGYTDLYAGCLAAAGALDEAEMYASHAIAASEELDDALGSGVAHSTLGRIRAARGDLEGAVAHFDESARLLGSVRTTMSLMFAIRTRVDRAMTRLAKGEATGADADIESAAKLALAPGSKAWVHLARAAAARQRGDIEEAERWAHEALDQAARFGIIYTITSALELLAGLAVAQGGAADAVRFLGAADALRKDKGDLVRYPPFTDWYEHDTRVARRELDEREFEDAWQRGAALRWKDAVAYAQRGRGKRNRPSTGWASLTPTERRVVGLVAEGLRDKEIAERLFVSVRTVGTHLSHIYSKLKVSSRTELVAEYARRET